MKLALRRDASIDATTLQKIACSLVRARLVSSFCHGGIVINNNLYHATSLNGLCKVNEGEWSPSRWDLFDLGCDGDGAALDLFEKNKGMSYDWFSLLAFVGFRAVDTSRVYCFEWSYWAITGTPPMLRVTPEDLILLAQKK